MPHGEDISVADYLSSPRHAHHFETSEAARGKIESRVLELRETGRVAGKTPIVNIQDEPEIIELHDGNATLVAWMIHAIEQDIPPRFELMARSFERVIVLRNRVHESGEVWHPFVPREVESAARLQRVRDEEQEGSETCKAVTLSGEAVYFDDPDYFSGVDACVPLGTLAKRLRVLLALAVVLVTTLACGAPSTRTPPEHIVLIVVDTLRRDHVSAYGDRARTPNIDAIASQGQAIRGALASFHQTTLSMAALFSGRTPSRESSDARKPMFLGGRSLCGLARFFGAEREPGCIPRAVSTLAERLRGGGYETAGVTTNPLLFRPAGFDRGFERWVELPGEPAALPGRQRAPGAPRVTEAALEQVREQPAGRHFLYVHYMDVHDYGLWAMSYSEAVEQVDAAIGTLVQELDRTGWLDDGLLLIVSDHGHRLGEAHVLPGTTGHLGNPSFEELLEIPVIVRPAIIDEQGGPPLRSEDLFRVVASAAGLQDLPASDLERDELLLSETRFRTYRRGRWKSFWSRDEDSLTLIDLESDPQEASDVGGRHPEVAAAHRARIATLSTALVGRRNLAPRPSALERERLEALGYIEDSRASDEAVGD